MPPPCPGKKTPCLYLTRCLPSQEWLCIAIRKADKNDYLMNLKSWEVHPADRLITYTVETSHEM